MSIHHIKNLYRHDLSSFIDFSFRELHPYIAYQYNWHIDVIAHALTKVESGEIKRLIINMPPRALKSHCTSVALGAWILGRDPHKKILHLHANDTLGKDLHELCLTLMKSPRYRSLFQHTVVKLQKRGLITTLGGGRQFMPLTGRLTGLGADIIIIDDPISTRDVMNKCEREKLHSQFDQNVLQRLDDKKSGAIVLIMPRVHDHDLTNHLLQKDEGWVHLNLPAIALFDEVWDLPHGRTCIRKKGEVLHEGRESRDQLLEILGSIGGYAFAYQYLQGLYKPRFGEDGKGGLWITPYKEGVFYDNRTEQPGSCGFYYFSEEDLILPKVFGIGNDPCPTNMRHKMTQKEWEHAYAGVTFDPETGVYTYPEDLQGNPPT